METIEFKDAIEEAAGTTKNLLLGNGFSMALDKSSGIPDEKNRFHYSSLFKAAHFESPLKDIFGDLKTDDFEKVMKALSDTKKILQHYHDTCQINGKMKEHIKGLKNSLIQAIKENHPEHQNCLDNKSCFCSNFLAHFIPKEGNSGRIFTLNYDLLLYWVLMRDNECKEPKLQFDDGFRERYAPIWKLPDNQTIYFLHGALHLYDGDVEIRKLKSEPKNELILQITKKIKNGLFPMFVSEGDSSKKLAKIQRNPYLDHAFEAFTDMVKSENQSLFIFGCSFNETDTHIFNVIKEGKIEKVFVSVYEDIESPNNLKLKEFIEKNRRSTLKIIPFDANSAQVWGSNI